jgi:glycosyltransferase involved in cell wall biosynthesis
VSLHVQHLLYEPRRGGVSQHVISTVRSLPEVRHSVLLAEGLPGVSAELIAAGAEVTPVPIRSRVLPRSAWDHLPRLIRRADADLLHLHNFHTGLFGSLAARLGGARRVVFTPQTLEMRKRALRPLFLTLLKQAARRHDAWIAVNRLQRESFQRLHPRPERVHWVPNAAPPLGPQPERTAARRALGLDDDALLVVYVGRLAAEKDPLTFVRAAARLPQLRFVLAGAGPLGERVAQETAGLDHVRSLGFVTDVERVWAAADIHCLPSRWEGQSYALLESLSRGTPAVATRIEGNLDLVRPGETGLLFEPADVEGLVRQLRALADDSDLRRRLGSAARALVEAEFSEPRVGQQLHRVYDAALRSRA